MVPMRAHSSSVATPAEPCSLRGLASATFFGLLFVGLLAGCGSGGAAPQPSGPSNSSSTTIGSSGGVLTSLDSKITLTVPPQALSGDTKIEIAAATASDASAAVGNYTFKLSPEGTTFANPMTLSVKIDPNWIPEDWSTSALTLSFWSGSAWTPVPTSINEGTQSLEAQIDHFSEWAPIARGSSNSSPDYTWEARNGCLRTTDVAYNAQLEALALMLFQTPVSDRVGCITGPYLENGYSRFFPTLENHAGIDFNAPTGIAVYAPFDGMVAIEKLDTSVPASTLTLESTLSGTVYRILLLHCSSHELVRGQQTVANPPLPVGTRVQKGDRVCLTGNVGALHSHLHVEVKRGLPAEQDLGNLRAMSGNRGVCATSSFANGWDKTSKTYTLLAGC